MVLSPATARRLRSLSSAVVHNVLRTFTSYDASQCSPQPLGLAKRASTRAHGTEFIVFACLIPVLVILSGVFAGLTLGYMSLDETQLNVLSISGTPKQREYANKIKPIRKNGHLLLVTLLLANMIVNESLPVISDPVLGGGIQSVAVSTVLIVIFSEIIPQSVCTRYGLYLGAKMATPTRFLIYGLGIVAWPVAKILELVLGPHHGIIYRRAELKELIAMHERTSAHGGDLKKDTVTIIGATLDLQEKVVRQAMTPIEDVFMLPIDAKLDYETLKRICLTGHSRVPVYEEVEVPAAVVASAGVTETRRPIKTKKIVGILLVKNCVMLDPKDAVPLRKIPLNKVPFVPMNEPLLGIMDKFQEGRSHMAIVSRYSVEKAASVKHAVKRGLTQRLRASVGMGDSSDEEDSDKPKDKESDRRSDGETTLADRDGSDSNGDSSSSGRPDKGFAARKRRHMKRRRSRKQPDLEMGAVDGAQDAEPSSSSAVAKGSRRASIQIQLPKPGAGLEQNLPADAVLGKEGAEEFLQGFDPAVMPLGIITLEDVLEELIGEEIYDEFDPQGAHAELSSYMPPDATPAAPLKGPALQVPLQAPAPVHVHAPATVFKPASATPLLRPIAIKGMNFLRSRSAPPTPRDGEAAAQDARMAHPPDILEPDEKDVEARVSMDDNTVVPLDRSANTSTKSTPGLPAAGVDLDELSKQRKTQPVSGLPSTATAVPVKVTQSLSPTPRTASPAPSLEAVLLERKRRIITQHAANPGGGSGAVVPAHAAADGGASASARAPGGHKGTRFKSSPLGGGERATGVVIAERVMADLKASQGEGEDAGGDGLVRKAGGGLSGDTRIHESKEKTGPDKEEGENA